MRLLLLAPPGAGKGTQAERLTSRFGIEHLATGELFRREVAQGTPLGRLAGRYLDAGDLVPDDVVLAMVRDRLEAAARAGGYVLDGFPRTLAQAEALDAMASVLGGAVLDAAVYLLVGSGELLRRLEARAQLDGRSDDQRATIEHRLEVFEHDTRPLLDYYRDQGILVTVNGEQDVESVTEEMLALLGTVVPGR